MLYYIGEVDLEPRSQRWSKLELGEIGCSLLLWFTLYYGLEKKSSIYCEKVMIFSDFAKKRHIASIKS